MKYQLDELFDRSNSEHFLEPYNAFYHTYRNAFACYAYKYCGNADDAASAANDALHKLWGKLKDHHSGKSNIEVTVGLLFEVAKGNAIDLYRKQVRRPITSLGVDIAIESDVEGINIVAFERFVELVENLAENDRGAWLLLSGLRDAEAARLLGIPDSTYRAKKKRWMKELKTALEAEGISYPAAIAAVSAVLKALPKPGAPDFLPFTPPQEPVSAVRPKGIPIVKAAVSITVLALAVGVYLLFIHSGTPFTWSTPKGGGSGWQFNNDIGPMGSVVVGDFVYVSDYVNKRILKFSATTGKFSGKYDIGFVSNDIDHDPMLQRFYIRSTFEVIAFDEQFKHLWTSPAESTEWMYYGLCVDSQSNIHVPTGANNTVLRFAPDGKMIGSYRFNPAGDFEGTKFIEATGGNIFVSAGKLGVFKLSEEGAFIEQVLEGDGGTAHLCKLSGNRIALYCDAQKALKVFDSNWNEIAIFPMTGHNGFSGEVAGLSADSRGNIFISEGGAGKRLHCINMETILQAEAR